MEQPIVQSIIILENLGRNTKQESINEVCIWLDNSVIHRSFPNIC